MSGVKHCVGCGYCCKQAMCFVGQYAIGRSYKKCPFLIWSEDRYLCKLAIGSKKYAHRILAGVGCCSPLNTWRRDVKERS